MLKTLLKKSTVSCLLAECFLLLALTSCGSRQPAVVDETQKSPTKALSHANLTSNCADCHEQDRKPAAVDLVTIPHGLGEDCSACHSFPLFTNIKTSAKAHNPAPKVCMGCHDRGTEMTVHVARGECAPCHQFGAAWGPK
ncbi:MAG: hypothetical protein EOP07_01700 [Proteobacteria bacterium]|nr:MAG: hypothetical protein EOP07_01700 [Pseudomonadota bacterium]